MGSEYEAFYLLSKCAFLMSFHSFGVSDLWAAAHGNWRPSPFKSSFAQIFFENPVDWFEFRAAFHVPIIRGVLNE